MSALPRLRSSLGSSLDPCTAGTHPTTPADDRIALIAETFDSATFAPPLLGECHCCTERFGLEEFEQHGESVYFCRSCAVVKDDLILAY